MTTEPEPYEWMFRSDGGGDFLDIMVALQRGIEDLSRTAGSFRLQDVTDHHPNSFCDEMIQIVGSWPLPDRLTQSRTQRFVNPEYVHKRNYADITVECACGAVMGRERDKWSWDGEHDHADNCRQEWREGARRRLNNRREEWIEKAAQLYLTYEEAAPRMGISRKHVSILCDRYDINWTERRKEGRERTILTWRKLHNDYDHTWSRIAEAFGANPSTVRTYGTGHGRNIDV